MALLLLGAPAPGNSGVTITGDAGHLSVSASDVSVRAVLEALAERKLLSVDSSLPLDQRISIELDGVTLETLVRRLVRQHSFVILTMPDAALPRLVVRGRGGASAAASWQSGPAASEFEAAVVELAHPDASVREEAVLTLSDIGDAAALPYLVAMLADASPDVREVAEAALEDLESTVSPPLQRQTDEGYEQ
ncbi:MAG: HEAT repeat domain-containing protein [Woeseiaceae bacterium]|nr:HEAT repeat domain-containing protein [Woeseiaceae bacterium]